MYKLESFFIIFKNVCWGLIKSISTGKDITNNIDIERVRHFYVNMGSFDFEQIQWRVPDIIVDSELLASIDVVTDTPNIQSVDNPAVGTKVTLGLYTAEEFPSILDNKEDGKR